MYWYEQGQVVFFDKVLLFLRRFMRAVHKETKLFLKIYFFTYNLFKSVTFKVLPSTLNTPLPTFFPFLEHVLERVLWDSVKVPFRIFFCFLYCLKFLDLLMRISTLGSRKSLQGPNLESRAAGGQQSSHASSKIHG